MANGAGGGVRNLRAMFENNSQPASPDVRGRSPAAHSNGSTSRPLSKVRTNFVAVEPMKRTSNDGSEPRDSGVHGRESFSLDEHRPSDAEVLSEIKKSVSRELELHRSSSNVAEVIPEDAIAGEAPPPLMGVEKHLAALPETTAVPSVTSTSVSRATSESQPDIPALDSSPLPAEPAPQQKSGFSPSPRVIRNLAENLRTPQPTPSAKSQQPPSTPTPASKRADREKAEARPKPTPVKAEAAETSHLGTLNESPGKSETERVGRAKPRLSSGTVTTGGFVKPKPRSPTRPIKLPAHLIAPTASSAAKHGDPPPAPRTLSRRSSTISSASRRPSTRHTQHPPMPSRPKQPAPQTASERAAPTPKSPTAPSSFLERMMRPTASSASKVKDKLNHTAGKK